MMDVCNQDLIRLSNAIYALGDFLLVIVTRFLISDRGNYKWFSFGVSGIIFVFIIISMMYLIETQGMENDDIYFILRGLKTRQQCLDKNENDLDIIIEKNRRTAQSLEILFIDDLKH